MDVLHVTNEILIVADGCTDGTADFVRQRHPEARLFVHEKGRGSIPSRNEMAAATTCDIFLSLDDDSHPIEADAIERLAEDKASLEELFMRLTKGELA